MARRADGINHLGNMEPKSGRWMSQFHRSDGSNGRKLRGNMRLIKLKTRTIAIAALAAVLPAALSGCVLANNLSPVDFGVENGRVSLSFCSAIEVTSIRVEQRAPGDSAGMDWQTVWAGEGVLRSKIGQVVTLAEAVEGFSGGPQAGLALEEGTEYAVDISYLSKAAGSPESVFQPIFRAPSGGLQEGIWVDANGKSSPEPCD